MIQFQCPGCQRTIKARDSARAATRNVHAAAPRFKFRSRGNIRPDLGRRKRHERRPSRFADRAGFAEQEFVGRRTGAGSAGAPGGQLFPSASPVAREHRSSIADCLADHWNRRSPPPPPPISPTSARARGRLRPRRFRSATPPGSPLDATLTFRWMHRPCQTLAPPAPPPVSLSLDDLLARRAGRPAPHSSRGHGSSSFESKKGKGHGKGSAAADSRA